MRLRCDETSRACVTEMVFIWISQSKLTNSQKRPFLFLLLLLLLFFFFPPTFCRLYLMNQLQSLDEVVGAGATLLRPRSFGEENNNPEAPTKTDKITTTFLTDLPTVGRDGVEFAAPDAATLKAKEATPNVVRI